jgi:hypothetical protein
MLIQKIPHQVTTPSHSEGIHFNAYHCVHALVTRQFYTKSNSATIIQ